MVCFQNLFSMNLGGMNPFCMGMYRSPMIYDMLSTNTFNMQNLRYNYLFEDIQARMFSGLMPSVFNGYFTPYQMNGGMFQTLTPPKNIEELARSCGINGSGFGLFNPLITPGSSQSSGSSSSGSSLTYQKINALKELLNQIKKDNNENTELSGKISEAIQNADKEKEASDKYEVLKKAYDELDEDLVKESLTNLTVADGKKISDLFKETGFSTEFSANSDITTLRDMIESISKQGNPTIAQSCILGEMNDNLDLGATQILDIISRWNNAVKDENGNVRNIFDFIQEKGSSCEDVQDLIDETVSPLVNSLTKKAESVIKEGKKCLSKTELDSLKKYSSDLTNITSSTKENNDNDFSEIRDAFNKLYVALRIASVKIINKKIHDKFGFLNDETFNDLYMKETVDDLKQEGFSNASITNLTGTQETDEQSGDANTTSGSSSASGSASTSTQGTAQPAKTKQQDKAYRDGGNVRYWLNKNTNAEDAQCVDDALKNINKNNVLDFLSGYHDEINGRRGIETIIEKMDDDNTAGKIKMENKKRFIKAIIDKAKDMGIDENDKNLKKIIKTFSLYEAGGRYANRKDFKRCRTPFWIWTGFARNDDEYLGKYIYRLYKTMKKIQNT